MYKKILVSLALDHGVGVRAIEVARRLRAADGEIIAVHVFEPLHSSVSLYVPAEHTKKVRAAAKKAIAERIGAEKDVEAVMLTGHSAQEIINFAEKTGADCIVVGSHKPELQDYFLGSTAARVVRHAPCAVHVLR